MRIAEEMMNRQPTKRLKKRKTKKKIRFSEDEEKKSTSVGRLGDSIDVLLHDEVQISVKHGSITPHKVENINPLRRDIDVGEDYRN